MRGYAYIAWERCILANAPYLGLKVVRRMLREKDPRLIQGTWTKGEGGCVIEQLARRDKRYRDAKCPGQEFVTEFGGVRFFADWDKGRISRRELYRSITLEMRERRRQFIKQRGRRVRACS